MIRTHRPTILLLGALLVAGCDTQGITVLAEVDESFGFESGLGDWSPLTTAGEGGTVSVSVSSDQAAAGTRSVRLAIDDQTGTAAALVTRRFDVEPDQAYRVELAFRLGTLDGVLDAAPWALVAGATPSVPTPAALPEVGSTGTAAETFVFEERAIELTATASPDGELWITLGVRQAAPGVRTYWIDEVDVALTRR